mmetsp:Transcript_28703/g.60001  ORF Transcript_28703/g.60001 Transcript_28703/m.60001 type:complete len:218 (-) Transcript_28703:99-752(-)
MCSSTNWYWIRARPSIHPFRHGTNAIHHWLPRKEQHDPAILHSCWVRTNDAIPQQRSNDEDNQVFLVAWCVRPMDSHSNARFPRVFSRARRAKADWHFHRSNQHWTSLIWSRRERHVARCGGKLAHDAYMLPKESRPPRPPDSGEDEHSTIEYCWTYLMFAIAVDAGESSRETRVPPEKDDSRPNSAPPNSLAWSMPQWPSRQATRPSTHIGAGREI